MDKSQSVLLLESSPLLLLLERTLLARRGWEIRTATSIGEAERQLRQATPNLVVSSDRLPDANGDEICRRLRSSLNGHPVPLLFVVGSNTDRTVASLREAGASEILFKPLIAHEVDQVVNRLLGLSVRRWRRRDFHTLVEIETDRSYMVVARNLSVDGMMVELPAGLTALAAGEKPRIRFLVPDHPREITGNAEVMWNRPIDGAAHAGLRFWQLDSGGSQRLTRYCGLMLEAEDKTAPQE